MLLDCANCGAPLDVKPSAWMATCAYCRRTQSVREKARAAPPTPANWRPPPQWRPPPASRAQQVMTYNPAAAASKHMRFVRFAVVLPILLTVGLGLLPVFLPMFQGQMSSWSWDGKETLECAGNDKKTLRDLDVKAKATPAIRVSGNCQLTIESSKIRGKDLFEVRENGRLTVKDSEVVVTGREGLKVDGNFGARLIGSKLTLDAQKEKVAHVLEANGNAAVTFEHSELIIKAAPNAEILVARASGNGKVELEDSKLTIRGGRRIVLTSGGSSLGRFRVAGGSIDAGGRDLVADGAHDVEGADLGGSKIVSGDGNSDTPGATEAAADVDCAKTLRCCIKVLGPQRCKSVESMPPAACRAAFDGYRRAAEATGARCD